jgi:propanediol utilization protein
LEDGELIDVRVGDTHRGVTLEGALVRIGANSFTEMHIDTDEANAAGIGPTSEGELLPEQSATIQQQKPA